MHNADLKSFLVKSTLVAVAMMLLFIGLGAGLYQLGSTASQLLMKEFAERKMQSPR